MESRGILIGIAGWSYDDWKGVVYPVGCRDTLRAVASLVDLVEINATFYRTPKVEVVSSWVERTADLATRFTAKLPQDVTHRPWRDAAIARAYRAALAPLVDSGRLDGLLAQFSHRLVAGGEALRLLERIVVEFGDAAPLVVELRHGSWKAPDWQRRVVDRGYGIAALDYPGIVRGGFVRAEAQPRSSLGYYRLHGRNVAAWFDKDAGRDATYDHLYTAAEVAELERRVERLAAAAAKLAVVANNHFRGKAVKLALELKAWRDAGPVEVPTELLQAYPELEAIAKGGQRTLF